MGVPHRVEICVSALDSGWEEWTSQAEAKLVARETERWCGLSEMGGHFPFGNESSQLRQLVNKLFQSAPSPVLGRR